MMKKKAILLLILVLAAPLARVASMPLKSAVHVDGTGNAAAWRGYFAANPSPIWAEPLGLKFSSPRMLQSFINVISATDLKPERLNGANSAMAQGLSVQKALDSFAAARAADVATIKNSKQVSDARRVLDDLEVLSAALPAGRRGEVAEARKVIQKHFYESVAASFQDRIEAARRAWAERRDGGMSFFSTPARSSNAGPLDDSRALSELFQGEKMGFVFNGDAGSGGWQKDIRGKSWLKDDARIVGFDIPQPAKYENGWAALPENDWKDIVVVNSEQNAFYPKRNTVDLAHVAFMEMGHPGWDKRLRRYQDLVRERGYFIVTHNDLEGPYVHGHEDVRKALFQEFLRKGEWELVAQYDHGQRPSDYPVTDWWFGFEDFATTPDGLKLIAQGYGKDNFILVFQKKKNAPSAPRAIPSLDFKLSAGH